MTTTPDTATLADRLRNLDLHELCEAWSADQIEMTDSSAERYGAAHDAVSTVIDEAIDALAAAKEAHDLTTAALAAAEQRSCSALCRDVEEDRDKLCTELNTARAEADTWWRRSENQVDVIADRDHAIERLTAERDAARAEVAELTQELARAFVIHCDKLLETTANGDAPDFSQIQLGDLDTATPDELRAEIRRLDHRLRWAYRHNDDNQTASLLGLFEIRKQREEDRAQVDAARAEVAELTQQRDQAVAALANARKTIAHELVAEGERIREAGHFAAAKAFGGAALFVMGDEALAVPVPAGDNQTAETRCLWLRGCDKPQTADRTGFCAEHEVRVATPLPPRFDEVPAGDTQLRVIVVLDRVRGRVHSVTTDEAVAQQHVRELAAKHGGDPDAATMTVGLVDPHPSVPAGDTSHDEPEVQS